MLILGIESTCDETAASIVRDGREVLSNAVATQFGLHEKFRGVVPEIASRAHIENILPVISEACGVANVRFDDVDAIAVASRPGLIGSLLIGVTAAKTLAWSLEKPLLAVDHVQAHLYSVMLNRGDHGPEFPAVGLVVSGGHTTLYLVRGWDDLSRIGSTIDDAVGEAYDKVAAMLGLPFPGGPVIDRLAASGDATQFKLPRPMLERDSLDFSFSGLKTAVKYAVFGQRGAARSLKEVSEQEKSDVAASFQAACVDVLVEKIRRAIDRFGARSLILGGGVSANRALRSAVKERLSVPAFVPEPEFCTDNAAMTAGLGFVHLSAGRTAGLALDAATFSEIAHHG
jgi:N6-L-threonylcarbamoyladenine synthase